MWSLKIANKATSDIEKILKWSVKHFGEEAGFRYLVLIDQAIQDLLENPHRPGSKHLEPLPTPGADWTRP